MNQLLQKNHNQRKKIQRKKQGAIVSNYQAATISSKNIVSISIPETKTPTKLQTKKNNNNKDIIILDETNSELSSMLNNDSSSSSSTPSSISTPSSQQDNIPVNKMDSERLYTISNSLKKTIKLSTNLMKDSHNNQNNNKNKISGGGGGGAGLFLNDNDIISIKQPTIGLQTPKILKKLNSMNQHPVSPITTTTNDINPFISTESSFHLSNNKDNTPESVKILNYLNNNNNKN